MDEDVMVQAVLTFCKFVLFESKSTFIARYCTRWFVNLSADRWAQEETW